MEAIELYKEECLKLLEYEEECKAAGKKVKISYMKLLEDENSVKISIFHKYR